MIEMKALIYIIIFFAFFDLFTQLPIMSPLAQSLGATPFLTGLAVGMYSFSNTIGNVSSGFLTDKKGPFRVLLVGLLLTGLVLFAYQLAFHAWSLLVVRFVHGLTAGLIVPAAFTYLANETAKERKGKGAAISGAFVGMAAVIGPAFSGIVAARSSETTVLSITACFMLLLGALAFFLLRSKKIPKKAGGKEPYIPVRTFFRSVPVLKAFSGAFFLMFSQGVLAYMLPLKVIELGRDTQTSGMLLSTFGIVAILVFLLPINNLFDRLNPLNTLAFGMITMGVSLVLVSASGSVPILYVILALYGVGFAFLFPSINTLLIGATKEANRGKAYGYFYAFFSFGVVIGSGLTGLLALSANEGFLFTGILMICVAVFLRFYRYSARIEEHG